MKICMWRNLSKAETSCISSCECFVGLRQSWIKLSLLAKAKHYLHLFWQYKRETLKTTKYVELVIVADNREVRSLKLKSYGKHRRETGSSVQLPWRCK